MSSKVKYFFLTRSLDPVTIQHSKIDSSSKKFELGFIDALNKKGSLEVIYIGKAKNKLNVSFINNTISYKCINLNSVSGLITLLTRITNTNNIVVTSAYYPFLSFALLMSKIFGTGVFSFIYDTHVSATENMTKVKKTFVNLYFKLGFAIAKKFSGFLVLNPTFIKELKIKTPYLKINIGITIDESKVFSYNKISKSDRKIICFAGTLNNDNGVKILLEAFEINKNLKFEIHFYGSGNLTQNILDIAKKDNRIKYLGNVSHDVLMEVFSNADFLINLRNPKATSSNFAFPSKFIDYLASNTDMISNLFPALDDVYLPYFIPIKAFTANAIIDCLIHLEKNETYGIKRTELKIMLKKNNNWDHIVDDILVFTSKLSK